MATTTPTYSWPVPTSTDYVADGAVAIEALGDAVDSTLSTALGGAYPGLRLVKKQTVGSGVSTVAVTAAFSATYENYVIVLSGIDASSADTNIYIAFPGSTGATYNSAGYAVSYAAGGGFTALANSSTGLFAALTGSDNQTSATIQLYSPFATRFTSFASQNIGTNFVGFLNGQNRDASSHTAFDLFPSAGTLTGGTIYVYGYGAS